MPAGSRLPSDVSGNEQSAQWRYRRCRETISGPGKAEGAMLAIAGSGRLWRLGPGTPIVQTRLERDDISGASRSRKAGGRDAEGETLKD
jgi:hypothetical protein